MFADHSVLKHSSVDNRLIATAGWILRSIQRKRVYLPTGMKVINHLFSTTLSALRLCLPICMAVSLSSVLTGCAPGPSVSVLGAYFPDWLFCITGAVITTILIHSIVRRFHRKSWFAVPALTYPLLAAVIALGSWLLVFQL